MFNRSLLVPMVLLLLVWTVLIAFINPEGEFTHNDDWGYVQLLESLAREGKMIQTGWGPGGPSIIVHVLWGWLFTSVWGYSFTMLRVSVLTLGVVGSVGLLILLRVAGVPIWLALWGTLCMVLNPLFLSQCFTFMTDITFLCFAIWSLLFLHVGVEQSKRSWVVGGLILAALSILTRQVGLMIPMAFVVMCFVHPKCRSLGSWRMAVLATLITVLPMVGYEWFLSSVGSTPLAKHEVIGNIVLFATSKGGVLAYLYFLYWQLAHMEGGYVSFFLSPIIALGYGYYWNLRVFRVFVIVLTGVFVAVEVALLAGWISLPIFFHRNIIYNLGIGPVILKDTYILRIRRTLGISPATYYFAVYWTILAGVILLANIGGTIRGIVRFYLDKAEADPPVFIAALTLIAALINAAILPFTGLHDRYLIPVLVFLVIWLLTGVRVWKNLSFTVKTVVPAAGVLIVIAGFSVLGVRDFMELKRAQVKAQDYLVQDLGVDPCKMDGGFEFNGYHCYRKGTNSAAKASWWWVAREGYLLTLGPLPGYRVVKLFLFRRLMGPNGAIHILRRNN